MWTRLKGYNRIKEKWELIKSIFIHLNHSRNELNKCDLRKSIRHDQQLVNEINEVSSSLVTTLNLTTCLPWNNKTNFYHRQPTPIEH